MASSSCFSQSLAASGPLDSLFSRRPCLPPSSLQLTLDPRSLSLTFSRSCFLSSSRPPKSFVVFTRAEFTTEDPQTLDGSPDDAVGGSEFENEPAGGGEFGGMDDRSPEGPKLYVGNLPWSCNSEEVAEVFQKVGSVEMVEVIYDRESGRSRGFGFVTMSSMEDAEAAVEKLNGADYGGRTLRVNFPDRNRADAPPPPRARFEDNTNKLFVGNIPWGVDDVTLEQMFSEHGKVLEAKIVFDRESGRSRGFGFVTMSSSSEVNEAINKMDGADVEGRSLRVNLAAARPASRQGDFF